MNIQFTLNGEAQQAECAPHESLMVLLRRLGAWSVKHGCETGECGACSVLVDGKLMPTCVMLAGQAEGHALVTVESLSPSHSADGQGVDIFSRPLSTAAPSSAATAPRPCCWPPQALLDRRAAAQRGPGARSAQRRAVPLHRLQEAGAGRAARGGRAARREPCRRWKGEGIPFESVFGTAVARSRDADFAGPGAGWRPARAARSPSSPSRSPW